MLLNPKSKIQNLKSLGWYREEKPTSFSHFALHPNLSAVHLYELPRQRKPQTGALRLSRLAGGLLKFKEDPFLIFCGDSRSRITHLDTNCAVLGVRPHPDPSPLGRKLDGVSYQIQKHLLDSSAIHWKRLGQITALDVKIDRFLDRQRSHGVLHRLQNVAQQRRLDLKFHLSGLDLRQVKNFIDQAE